jgi:DNA-binding winged helix-turn-helix (wHTH) protein/pimeloyl-ACP methyl ester carboxylesterase/class 3 adenylate cyclase
MTARAHRFYQFGHFRLDLEDRILRKSGEAVPLTPKALDTLVVLLENCGRVLEKDDLMNRVWPDTFVEEANLAVNISVLRKALGPSPSGGQYIETVPRRGYRFAAEVTETPCDREELIVRERTRSRVLIEEEDSPGGGFNSVTIQAANPEPSAGHDASPVSEPIIRRPETRYARSGDVNIAYQVIGEGTVDLVFVMGWVSHLEYFWTDPLFARFLKRLASFSRLILFDKRGTGLSDRVPLNELPTLEQRMDDVRAVMDAVGSERAALCGISEGGPMCSLFAATYPEKTIALVMIGTYAKRIWDPDYPWGPTLEERQKFYDEIQSDWGGPVGLEERAPSVAHDPQFRNWWATYLRMGASPGAALALTHMNAEIDVRGVLPTIRVPALIIHRTGDICLRVEEGRYVAQNIPGAKFVELPGVDHLPFVGNQDEILYQVEEFLTGVRHVPEPDRMLATVLFARTIGPASGAAVPSEARWAELLDRYHTQVRKEVEWFRGRDIEIASDGFLATFDGPARAIRTACAIREAAIRLGIETKAGLHTGECDITDHRVTGMAVDIGEQVVDKAEPGEVLVSRTVKDLVAGSGIAFEDRGEHVLKGVAGEWRLFSVARGACN